MCLALTSTLDTTTIPLLGLAFFLAIVVAICLSNFRTLFGDWQHGRRHRIAGGLHLLWLVVGCGRLFGHLIRGVCEDHQHWDDDADQQQLLLYYDIILGCLGVTATLTAAADFPHRYVSNCPGQSGTLSELAMVTQSEMQEHAFYQGLNLVQILYLHGMGGPVMCHRQNAEATSFFLFWDERFLALLLVTAPWLLRQSFPVHSFSQNWRNEDKVRSVGASETTKEDDTLNHMYQVKKLQYLFYKHVVFHGVNLTVFLAAEDTATSSIVHTLPWRIFWLCLNTSYVMEFFLQSLVRRRILPQSSMLALNALLMSVSSLAAAAGLRPVLRRWDVCLASLLLNLTRRGHDVLHTLLIAAVAMVFPVVANARRSSWITTVSG